MRVFAIALTLFVCGSATAQPVRVDLSTRRALIICGLPGDEVYAEQFTQSVADIHRTLTQQFGFTERHVRIQFARADESDDVTAGNELPLAFPVDGMATREEIASKAKRLQESVQPHDMTWIFVIGQAYFDGKSVFLNLPKADINHKQFGKLFTMLQGQSTFFISSPASGFYIKPLAKKNRVIVTSAEADAETNGSVFHLALAKAMSEMTPEAESDIDGDGKSTVLDLYIKTVQNLTDLYYENDPPLIPTEHPLLDDNADGRGSELQIDYLTMAQGGRSDSKRKRRLREFKDGKLASSLILPFVSK